MRKKGGAPCEEADLVALSSAGNLVLEVVDGVAGRVGGKVADEVLVVLRLGRLLDDDLLVVVRELEGDVLDLYE
jgi:hypothetical protein